MKKRIVSGFAAMGMAAAIIVPLSNGAQGRETRAERSASTINQSTDRADARIAILKADLRLSSDQAQHWAGLESALHDIVAKRAKSSAASRDPQTGRSINTPVASDSSITEDEKDQGTRSERDARKARLDDIDECGARPTPTPCRPRTCARSPTQRSRSTTHLMTANATGSCNSFAKI
jgi:hypothetical protein